MDQISENAQNRKNGVGWSNIVKFLICLYLVMIFINACIQNITGKDLSGFVHDLQDIRVVETGQIAKSQYEAATEPSLEHENSDSVERPIDDESNSFSATATKSTWGKSNRAEIYLCVWVSLVILGVILGAKEKITVFRNYNDLGLVFLIPVVPFFLICFLVYFRMHGNVLIPFAIGLLALLLAYITYRTLDDNQSIFKTLLALLTKLTLGPLFVANLMTLINPSGKTGRERANARGRATIFLLVLAPIIGMLVRDKVGIFTPHMLRGRGIRGIGTIRNSL